MEMVQAYLKDKDVVCKNTEGETFALSIKVFVHGQQTALHLPLASAQDVATFDSVRQACNQLCLHVSQIKALRLAQRYYFHSYDAPFAHLISSCVVVHIQLLIRYYPSDLNVESAQMPNGCLVTHPRSALTDIEPSIVRPTPKLNPLPHRRPRQLRRPQICW